VNIEFCFDDASEFMDGLEQYSVNEWWGWWYLVFTLLEAINEGS